MKRFSKTQRATIASLIVIGLFNPLAVEVLGDWFKMFYTCLFVGATIWVCGFILFKSLKPEVVNLPTVDTEEQDYIA